MPHWPYFLNVNGDFISAPVLRSVAMLAARQRLAVVLVEHRLGIEAVHLRQAAVHEQEDDVLGARGMIERPRRRRWSASGPQLERLADQAGEREHAEAVAHPAEGVAAGNGS